MKKKRIKLEKGEHKSVGKVAERVAGCLIAAEGLRRALVIARLVHEKTFAQYKKVERKYGKIDW